MIPSLLRLRWLASWKHGSQVPCTMELPPELLTMVCQYLTKAELKIFRLTSKTYDRAAVPLLFNEVFLSTNGADFEVASLTVRHFGPYIKTLLFSSVYYPAMSWSEFKRRTLSQRYGSGRPPNLDEHLRLGYRNYSRAQTKQKTDLETGLTMAHLCSVLHSIPNLEMLILLETGSLHSRHRRGRGFWDGAEACPVQGCTLSDNQHLEFQLCPTSGFRSSVANTWDFAMLAMWSTSSTVKELAVEPEMSSVGLPHWAFDMTRPRPFLLRDHFQHLTKLRLVLSTGPGDSRHCCITERHIAKTLSAATQLESLHLDVGATKFDQTGVNVRVPFRAVLDGCRFAKLKSCTLRFVHSTSDELLGFLRASPGLKCLVVDHHTLTAGLWEATAETMRACLDLTDVTLDRLSGGWPAEYGPRYTLEWRNDHVRRFFLEGDSNPFSRAAMKK